jgi:hypothetical protein
VRESETNILRTVDKSGESGEGRRKYLEVRKRIREGEDLDGVTGDLLESAQASIRSVKWK